MGKMDHWFAKNLYLTTKEDVTKKYRENLEPEVYTQYFASIRKGNFGGMIDEVGFILNIRFFLINFISFYCFYVVDKNIRNSFF